MDKILLEELNKQINKEFYSAYLYFALSLYFYEINMDGFAKMIDKQAKEELNHAKKIYNFLIARDEKISLFPIELPEYNFVNPLDGIKSALHHEKIITNSINNLYKIAHEAKDYASEVFLQWFITEQIEEEEKFRKMLSKMENIENYDCEIVNMDRRLENNTDV